MKSIQPFFLIMIAEEGEDEGKPENTVYKMSVLV